MRRSRSRVPFPLASVERRQIGAQHAQVVFLQRPGPFRAGPERDATCRSWVRRGTAQLHGELHREHVAELLRAFAVADFDALVGLVDSRAQRQIGRAVFDRPGLGPSGSDAPPAPAPDRPARCGRQFGQRIPAAGRPAQRRSASQLRARPTRERMPARPPVADHGEHRRAGQRVRLAGPAGGRADAPRRLPAAGSAPAALRSSAAWRAVPTRFR